MLDVSHHFNLARRAADFVQQSQGSDNGPKDNPFAMPPWAALVLVFTVLAYYVSLIKIRYTIGSVIGTLAMIEESENNVLVEVDCSDEEGLDKKATDGLLESETAVIKLKPVTSRIRMAMTLLKSTGGRRGQFRGFSLFVVYGFLKSVLTMLLASVLPMHGAFIAAIGAETLLAKLEMVWVHHVISEPSSTTWIQRARSTPVAWKKIAPAAAVRAIAFQYVLVMPMFLLCSFKPLFASLHRKDADISVEDAQTAMLLVAGAGLLALVSCILVYIPANVTFVRTAASLLPEEDNTIVNFDRTFGDKVAAGEMIGFLDAWKSFDWSQRRRYVGLMCKVVGIMAAVTVLFSFVVATEVTFFTGQRLQDLARAKLH